MAIKAVKDMMSVYQGATEKTSSNKAAEAASAVEKSSSSTSTSSDTIEISERFGGQTYTANDTVHSMEAVKRAVKEINNQMNNDSMVRFGYHEATNRITIKIVNRETDEVIKEFPAEETLDMIAKAWELAGLMVDEKR